MKFPDLFPTIETPRLLLRQLSLDDAEPQFEIMKDSAVTRYWGSGTWSELQQSIESIENTIKYFESGDSFKWAIVRKEDGVFLGTASLWNFKFAHRYAEIGYLIGREFWGNGYAPEAMLEVLRFGFETLDLNRIEADTDPRNQNSIRVLQKLGMIQEGLLRQRWIVEGEISDTALFAILKQDWNPNRGT